MIIFITKTFIENLRKFAQTAEFLPNEPPWAVAIIDGVNCGCGCGSNDDPFFPFKVVPINESNAQNDVTLTLYSQPNLPEEIHLYLGAELNGAFGETVVLDSVDCDQGPLFFIPMITRPLHEYDFYVSNSQ